jgi:hypothetical protein
LAMTYEVDIFLIAECPKDTSPLVTEASVAKETIL